MAPRKKIEPVVKESLATIAEMEKERRTWLKKRFDHGEMDNPAVYEECCANLRRLNFAIIDQGGVPG